MDFNENLYDKIQAYLDKDLSPEETREFERAIAADEELAREVELHADLQELLADTPENNLRKNLEKLSAESVEDKSGFDWRLLALIPIIFAIIGFLMFGTNEVKKTDAKITSPAILGDTIINSKEDDTITNTKIDSSLIELQKTSPEVSKEKVEEQKNKTKSKTNTKTKNKKTKKSTNINKPPIIEINPPSIKGSTSNDTSSTSELHIEPFELMIDTNTYADLNPIETTAPYVSESAPDVNPSQETITRVLSSPPSGNDFPFENNKYLDSLVAIDYLAQEDFSLSIIHKVPDTIRMPKDSITVAYYNEDYLRELGFYFTANIETENSLNGNRFIASTKENRGYTWGLDIDFLEQIGENSYKMDARTIFPAAEGLYYYEVYDEINDRQIYAGKYVVIAIPNKDKSEEIYIAFNTNSSLEFLIANNTTRSSDFKFNVETKSDSFNIQFPNEAISFQFIGSINTEDDLLTKNLKIHLFSNDEERFNDFSMLSTDDFKLESKGDDMYNFDFKTNYNLEQGLYYFLVEDAETQDILYTNKFVIREGE